MGRECQIVEDDYKFYRVEFYFWTKKKRKGRNDGSDWIRDNVFELIFLLLQNCSCTIIKNLPAVGALKFQNTTRHNHVGLIYLHVQEKK